MAALLLTSAVAGSSLTGFSLFAATLAASTIGSFIDSKLFPQTFEQEGPRLENITLSSATEGVPIKRLFATSRLGGNIIWVTNFREVKNVTSEKVGGKGGGGSTVTTTEYEYSVSVAFAFCEGNGRATLGRVWADSRLLETSALTFRFYPGSETQNPDPKIIATEGNTYVSGHRGVAYLVFEDLPLADFGNRIPQITAEVNVPIDDPSAEIMENLIESVNLIPATGEQVYATTPSTTEFGGEVSFSNTNLSTDKTDFVWSMENLKAQMPNVTSLNLVVSWFGTDLRLGSCEIIPKAEYDYTSGVSSNNAGGLVGFFNPAFIAANPDWKAQLGLGGQSSDTWLVNGLKRNQAQKVSKDSNGNPNFGGTCTDWSITEAVLHLLDVAEIDVHFYPFILMDILAGNSLPNTDGVTTGQPAFPWRGRITTSTPSIDETAAAKTEMDSFFGTVARTDFNTSGTIINYTGSPTDFGYRRMVLHYAHVCAAAAAAATNTNKFKTFYIGTEMVGLNRVRDNTGAYVGVDQFVTLLEDVRLVFDSYGVTGVELSYAADWSEYHSHQPDDGSGDINFPLDALWAHDDCDHIAIDNYLPISDWRDGTSHLDYGSGADSYGNPKALYVYDQPYLKGQIEGGELWDYYYASESDRENQVRTPIVDGAYSKDWIFRQKDLVGWWSNTHYERVANVEKVSPTGWTAGMKRVRFSEYGVPCIDKGTNKPNVFYDPKSSESFFPYFSDGRRDDQIQRSYYEAMITYWRDNSPVSPIRMLATSDMCVWTWDARPYPAYPYRSDIWSDATNWNLGHWVNGRAGSVPLSDLVKLICGWVGFTDSEIDVTELVGKNSIVRGYVIDNQSSPRSALKPLFSAYMFDGFESQGKLKFTLREYTTFAPISQQDMIVQNGKPSGYEIVRAQETEMPQNSSVSFINPGDDYQVGSTGGSRQITTSLSSLDIRYPIVFGSLVAKALSEILIQEAWAARESIEFGLSPEHIGFDPGDGISINIGGRTQNFRLSGISKGSFLEMEGQGMDVEIYDVVVANVGSNTTTTVPTIGSTRLHFLDVPLLTGDEPRPWAPRVAAYQNPFPRSINVYEVVDGGADLALNTNLFVPCQMGVLATDLPTGPFSIIDEGNTLQVDIYSSMYQPLSASEDNVRNGVNALAVKTDSGDWEIIKFINATYVGNNRYNLERLFRGQLGTYSIMEASISAGQPVVFLNDPSAVYIMQITEERKFDGITWRFGPSSYETASGHFSTRDHVGKAVGQLPYPVADVQFHKTGASDVKITWKRQTRFGGEGFDSALVPLNEDDERYEIDLLTSADVLITTVSVTTPEYVYSSAPANFKARIYQMSNSVGRGRPVNEQSQF